MLGRADIDIGGDGEPGRVLAPEVRRLRAAAVAIVDGVARLVAGRRRSGGPGEGQRGVQESCNKAERFTGRAHRD